MKSIIAAILLTTAGFTFAKSQLGEVNLTQCECQDCLVNGKCVMTKANGQRTVVDVKGQTKPKKRSGGSKSGAKGGI